MPLANTSVTLAGQPSKIGGTVTRVLGWMVLGGGWTIAALTAGLILLISNGVATGGAMAVGLPIAFVASLLGYILLRSGRELKKSGDDTELATKNQAIFALANTRNGVLKAWDVAQSLQVSPKEADDMLTVLAKEHPDHVSVDIDDNGNVLYRFPSVHWGGIAQMAPNAVPPHVRVAAPQQRVATEARVATPAGEELDDAMADEQRQRAR